MSCNHVSLGARWMLCALMLPIAHSPVVSADDRPAVDSPVELGDMLITLPEHTPGSDTYRTRDLPPGADTGDLLRNTTGVSGARMGGHGTDPVIRGLGQHRINVLLDGAFVEGACPNRMDPPTAYAPVSAYDRVTILRGRHSLEYAGGPGGTILLERDTERFGAGKSWRGTLHSGYRGNADAVQMGVDVAGGGEGGFARFLASRAEAGNYEDGDGKPVRSASNEQTGGVILGWTPSEATRLEASAERQRLRDVLFAGAGMDSPASDNDSYRLKFRSTALPGIAVLRAELFASRVDHVMDNYTLREPPSPMMRMRAPSSSDTHGGRIVSEMHSPIGRWRLGVTTRNNERAAVRINDANNSLNSVLWPDVTIEQAGIFSELEHAIGIRQRLTMGLRYDRVRAEARQADRQPDGMMLSPNALYAMYYDGIQAAPEAEHHWSVLLRVEHELATWNGVLYSSLSRTLRTADATERYLASNSGTPDGRWVGNPHIQPERHHQVEVGSVTHHGVLLLESAAYYNDVADYILRDRFGEAGNNATVYRNIDATLWGGELSLAYRPTAGWFGEAGLAYVRATNDSARRPIAQTPPLEGMTQLGYSTTRWEVASRMRVAQRQHRVDSDPTTGSGLDVRRTPGWAVFDLRARFAPSVHWRVDAGVDNLFDRSYAQHLNRASAFDAEQVQVNEPGRNVWLQVRYRFQ